MVELIGVVPLFVAVNEGIEPVPELVPKPISSLLFIQLKLVPLTGLVGLITDEFCPSQRAIRLVALTVGIGLIVILKLVAGPIQEFDSA